ncbi:hypothetical protein CEXT_85061 [Caerostris extrusa]|uniref:Uncharacterized protein n=1 Tax=Caerostris extrusa TaxID=172846 RepID=A0AAV4UE34_CAEEX|nr:hypothetical protein CEXT_85061 [Caerostris extrusa]
MVAGSIHFCGNHRSCLEKKDWDGVACISMLVFRNQNTETPELGSRFLKASVFLVFLFGTLMCMLGTVMRFGFKDIVVFLSEITKTVDNANEDYYLLKPTLVKTRVVGVDSGKYEIEFTGREDIHINAVVAYCFDSLKNADAKLHYCSD